MHCQAELRLSSPGQLKAARRRYKTFMIDEILSKETCDYFEKLSLYSVCPSLIVRPKPLHSCSGKKTFILLLLITSTYKKIYILTKIITKLKRKWEYVIFMDKKMSHICQTGRFIIDICLFLLKYDLQFIYKVNFVYKSSETCTIRVQRVVLRVKLFLSLLPWKWNFSICRPDSIVRLTQAVKSDPEWIISTKVAPATSRFTSLQLDSQQVSCSCCRNSQQPWCFGL